MYTPGWDFIDDDSDPNEESDGADESSHGHGTAVAGVVTLVAPQVRILPYRVLDTHGHGTVFVAAAIQDAITAGANVINLSLGTSRKTESNVQKQQQQRTVSTWPLRQGSVSAEVHNVEVGEGHWQLSRELAVSRTG